MAPTHKLDTLLNPEKAEKYNLNKEKAMEDIRAAFEKIVTLMKYFYFLTMNYLQTDTFGWRRGF